jgi:hypothetical protein
MIYNLSIVKAAFIVLRGGKKYQAGKIKVNYSFI